MERYIEYGGYRVYPDGKVTDKYGRDRHPTLRRDGYYNICLTVDGERQTMLLHRLVASLYVPNPDNNTIVHHIDGNKKNNHCSNLEWVDRTHNAYAYIIGAKRSIPVVCIIPDCDLECVYFSYREACRRTGISLPELQRCIRSGRPDKQGRTWRKHEESYSKN